MTVLKKKADCKKHIQKIKDNTLYALLCADFMLQVKLYIWYQNWRVKNLKHSAVHAICALSLISAK